MKLPTETLLDPPRRRVPRNLQIAILAAVLVAVGLVWGAASLIAALTKPKPVAEAPVTPGSFRPTPQQWANLTLARAEYREFAASLDTDGRIATDDDRTTQVFTPLSGQVTRVWAKAGDAVARGAPLFEIRATEFVQGQADLVAAVSLLKVTEAAKSRQEALLKIQGAALKDVQQSQADYANARAGLEAVRNRLRILGKSEAQIAALEREASGAPMTAETLVSAPVSGTVTQRAVGPGQNVASVVNNGGTTPAFTVSDLRTVWLVANVREADAGRVRLGAPIQAHIAAFPDKTFAGTISFIAPTVDPNSRRIAVRATLDNPAGLLRPEMFADVTLASGAPSRSLSAPQNAVIYEGDDARVWVAASDRTLSLRKIRTGRSAAGRVEVLAGLNPGERVVDGGALFIDRAASSD